MTTLTARQGQGSLDVGVRTECCGMLPYRAALQRQRLLWRRIVAGRCLDTVLTLEHPPTVTLGRHAPSADLLCAPSELKRRGIALVRSDRGGRATYHGPGQLVVYPIVNIASRGLGARRWVELLESVLLAVLADYGIQGSLVAKKPGIWVGGAKIASLGLRIARGVSYHGVALNVNLDLAPFDCIVPCGAPHERMTTMAAEAATAPALPAVASRLCRWLLCELADHELR